MISLTNHDLQGLVEQWGRYNLPRYITTMVGKWVIWPSGVYLSQFPTFPSHSLLSDASARRDRAARAPEPSVRWREVGCAGHIDGGMVKKFAKKWSLYIYIYKLIYIYISLVVVYVYVYLSIYIYIMAIEWVLGGTWFSGGKHMEYNVLT